METYIENAVKSVNISDNEKTPSQDLMLCSSCKKYRPYSMMSVASFKRGKMKRCRPCENAYTRNWRKVNAEKNNLYHREWRAKNKEAEKKHRYMRRQNKLSNPETAFALRKYESEKTKRLNAVLKNEVFTAYGGWVCACCGETERSFLSMDHMLNNGGVLRKTGVHGHSSQFYRWLKNNGYPKDFQVLCMNCQFGKRMNKGTCPHQVRRNDYPFMGVEPSGSKRSATEKVDEIVCSAW